MIGTHSHGLSTPGSGHSHTEAKTSSSRYSPYPGEFPCQLNTTGSWRTIFCKGKGKQGLVVVWKAQNEKATDKV